MQAIALPSPFMGERKSKTEAATIGLRLDPDLLRRIRAYAQAHKFKPSLTSLINDAMLEWLERHEAEVEMPKPKK